ncbi:hypothetical protein GGTG_04860 [Gaeumannomyces tritici R3-111a-1]|uniref:Uncharacterized protein n=1 Tax=Gaeumannomyces tritici (strain R3-111a-1) TaxID=644352 RepID=J3NUA6_GAET3|nr:hypothetical protein GGTG_04860 [Gaeumannomyces tritici R3-111a-1]EJT79777.1 hypothetical protein GGTG_04860 [Gaeumannomyces tritici R3-111a-1]
MEARDLASIFNQTNPVPRALELIDTAGLAEPFDSLLTSFVQSAAVNRDAAEYILRSCTDWYDDEVLRRDLYCLVSDWRQIVETVFVHGSLPPPPDEKAEAVIRKRDAGRCCITGKTGSYGDPLVIVPVIPIPLLWETLVQQNPRIGQMLEAFFGAQLTSWFEWYLRGTHYMNPYHTHWLVRKSAADAFAQGFLALKKWPLSQVEFTVEDTDVFPMEYPIDKVGPVALLVDHSRQGSPKVDWRLLVTQEMLSESIRWLAIARELERRRAQTPTAAQHGTVFARLDLAAKAVRPVGRLLGGALLALWRLAPTRLRVVVYKLLALWRLAPAGLRAAVLALWRLAPARLRVVVYKLLASAGRWLYGEGPAQTQRLPFGLYLKKNKNGEAARNEFNALKIDARCGKQGHVGEGPPGLRPPDAGVPAAAPGRTQHGQPARHLQLARRADLRPPNQWLPCSLGPVQGRGRVQQAGPRGRRRPGQGRPRAHLTGGQGPVSRRLPGQ